MCVNQEGAGDNTQMEVLQEWQQHLQVCAVGRKASLAHLTDVETSQFHILHSLHFSYTVCTEFHYFAQTGLLSEERDNTPCGNP